MAKLDKEELGVLIDKIRGSTPKSELRQEVEDMIKADDEKAKVKTEADKKILDDIKAKEELLRKKKIKKDKTVVPPTEEKKKKTNIELHNEKLKIQLEADSENEEEEAETTEIIEKLTEQMKEMAKEIKALKKRKNYRTPAPKGEDIDAKDLPDFIKQQTQNIENAEYETIV